MFSALGWAVVSCVQILIKIECIPFLNLAVIPMAV